MICSICLHECLNSLNKNKSPVNSFHEETPLVEGVSQNFHNNIKMECCKNYLHAECLARLIYCNHMTCPYCREKIILNNYFTDDSFNLVTDNLYECDYSYLQDIINDRDITSFFAYRHIYLLNVINLMYEYLLFIRIKNRILFNLSYKEYTFCGLKKNIPSFKRFFNLVLIHIILNIHYVLLFIIIILLCNSAITHSINNPKHNYSPNVGVHYRYRYN